MNRTRLSKALQAALLCLVITAGPTGAQETLTGVASVIDGDTLEVRGQRIRLHGIDAPESAQRCLRPSGENWRCGQQAALALADRIGRTPVTCNGTTRDRYGRLVAVCFKGSEDLNGWMVSQGWAVAYRRYSKDYVAQEREAKDAGRGVWTGTFVMPWDWRRGLGVVQSRASGDTSSECLIKGNINSEGEHIYHVPGGEHYNRTKITESKGERWFCSEKEAQKAGWRRSME